MDTDAFLGADLDANEGASAPVTPAPAGYTADARGNLYQDAPSPAPATAAVPAVADPAPVQAPAAPVPDPAAMQAAQMAMQRAQAAEAALARYEQQQWETRVMQLPEAQRAAEVAKRAIQAAQMQAQQQQQAVLAQQAALEPMAKEMVVREFAQRYGVTADDLRRFPTPEAMEAFGAYVAEQRRVAQNTQRTQQGTDAAARAGTGTSVRGSWKQTTLSQDLTNMFAGT